MDAALNAKKRLRRDCSSSAGVASSSIGVNGATRICGISMTIPKN